MKTLLRILILFLIFTIGIVSFLLTPSGLNVAMKIVTPFIPGKISYKKISGVVVGPIEMDDFHYQTGTETIDIKKLQFNWQPFDLLKRDFQISSLNAKGVTVTIHDPFFPTTFNEKAIREWFSDLINTLKTSHNFLHTSIQHAHLSDIQINDSFNQPQI